MEHLISVVIPIYNVEKYIVQCIESVINQSYEMLEIILVNDGSTDNCSSIIEQYEKQYSNLITVINRKNGGLGAARNSGIDCAKGDFITFVDGDDYLEPDHIMLLYKNIMDTNSDVAFGGNKKFNSECFICYPNILAGKKFNKNDAIKNIIPRMCGVEKTLTDGIAMSVCMNLYRTSIIKENALRFVSEKEYISEDFIFNIEYMQYIENACCTDVVSYCYRQNDMSLTRKYREDRFEKQKKMMVEVTRRTQELDIYDLCEQRIINTFLAWTRECMRAEQGNSCYSVKVAMQRIRRLCEDELVVWAYKNKGSTKLSIFTNLVDIFARKKCVSIIWLLMLIKNIFKRH